MRILVLSNLYPPDVMGGYELLARDLAGALAQRGHDVDVLTTGDGEASDGVTRTLRLARPFGRPARRDRLRHAVAGVHNARATRRWLSTRERPDAALVMSQRRLGLAPLRVLATARVPMVFTVNDDWPVAYCQAPQAGRPASLVACAARAARWLFAAQTWKGVAVRRIVYLSDAVRRTVLEAGAPFPEGIVRSQGIDRALFSPRVFRPMRRSPRLLFVGRLHPSKAPEVALDTLGALVKRGIDATLTVAGEADDRAFGAALSARAGALGVGERVAWLGTIPREELPAVYGDADALLFASRLAHEGQGLTYLEAMACGLPVVASPSGGAREFLERHPAARLARACSGEAFADEIMALHGDAAGQEELVARALRVVRAEASLDVYARALEGQLQAAAREVRAAGERRS